MQARYTSDFPAHDLIFNAQDQLEQERPRQSKISQKLWDSCVSSLIAEKAWTMSRLGKFSAVSHNAVHGVASTNSIESTVLSFPSSRLNCKLYAPRYKSRLKDSRYTNELRDTENAENDINLWHNELKIVRKLIEGCFG